MIGRGWRAVAVSLTLVGLLAALAWSMAGLFTGHQWAVVFGLYGAGMLAGLALLRALRVPPWLLPLVAVGALAGFLTARFAPGTGIWNFIPTLETANAVARLCSPLGQEFVEGITPLPLTPELELIVAAAAGVLAFLLDGLVVSLGWSLAAGIFALAGLAVPITFASHGVPAGSPIVLLAAVLAIMWASTAPGWMGRRRRVRARLAGGVRSVIAITVACAAGFGVLLAFPNLTNPPLTSAFPRLSVLGDGVNALIELGEDLTNQRDTVAFTYTTRADDPTNFRLTTLADFDGQTWRHYGGELTSAEAQAPPIPGWTYSGLQPDSLNATVTIENLRSPWLPVPYYPRSIKDLTGQWMRDLADSTLTSLDGTQKGQTYTVYSALIGPEQGPAQVSEPIQTIDCTWTVQPDGAVEIQCEGPQVCRYSLPPGDSFEWSTDQDSDSQTVIPGIGEVRALTFSAGELEECIDDVFDPRTIPRFWEYLIDQVGIGQVPAGETFTLENLEDPRPDPFFSAEFAPYSGVTWPMPAWVIETVEAALNAEPRLSDEFDSSLGQRLLLAQVVQDYFRSDVFTYSTTAPSQFGYDGDSMAMIEQFMAAKSGYCVHFASAMAVLSRYMGIPSRIAIGYRPGRLVETAADGTKTYSVSSRNLHAWPELYFEGLGWISYEPTPGQGITGPRPSQPAGQTPSPTPSATPTPSPSASTVPSPTGGAMGLETDPTPSGNPNAAARPGLGAAKTAWIAAAGTAALALVLALPAISRSLRRRRRYHLISQAASTGAAWREVIDTANDLGFDTRATLTPQVIATNLTARLPSPSATALADLTDQVELQAFAPDPPPGDGASLKRWTRTITSALRASVTRRRRLLARLAPRSLWRRRPH